LTDDTVNPVDISNDLEAFENDFFGKTTPEPVVDEPTEEAEAEVEAEIEDDTLATVEDDEPTEPEAEEPEEETEDEPEEEVEPEPKKGKKTAKERIEELVAKNREAERREAELIRRLEALEAQKEVKAEKPLREALSDNAPHPDAVDDDGEPIYPLGEFDPTYIRDLTKFTIAEETKLIEAEKAKKAEAARIEAEQKELSDAWGDKVAKAEEEYPDIRSAITDLADVFVDIEPGYGEYLATTIMSSDYGPELMYYLSQNIGEAQKIVASGPAAATLALGRLEARFEKPKTQEQKRNKVPSKAPAPPKNTRGNQGKFDASPDTDDLEAFEKVFFK
jgi:chemotaxis protein histidine kinase CheA